MKTIHLMNKYTGGVDTKEGWTHDYNTMRDKDKTLEHYMSTLVKVKQVKGNWEEVN